MIGKFAKRNRFNFKPFDDLFTCKMGYAIPYRCIPVLPGDTWHMQHFPLSRMMAMISPAFGKVIVRLHTFFVPYRVIWPEFYEGFMIQKQNDDGTLADPSVMPTITNTWTEGSLGDYLGYPLGVPYTSNALKIRAYQKIIRDWYLNTNIEDEYDINISTASGVDTTTDTNLFQVNYPRDYFTGCFSSRQRGEELPIPVDSGTAPVIGNGEALGVRFKTEWGDLVNNGYFRLNKDDYMTHASYLGDYGTNKLNIGDDGTYISNDAHGVIGIATDPNRSGLVANLSNISSVNPSDFRLIWQLNLKRQKDMYAGSRTVDWMQEHYGVRVPDARLQRSEFLGGCKTYFNVSEVLQTSATDASTTPQGNMAGHGFSVAASKPIHKTFDEHGVIVCMLSIAPQAMYMQGSPREDMKRTPEEFGLPVLSHTIMDAVKKGQLYWTGTDTDNEPLGYRNIYDEYRFQYSSVKGAFRNSLDFWHWGRKFANQPALNKDLIAVEQNDRPFATSNEDHFLVKVTTKAKAYRPLPKIGTPLFLDHM